MEKYYLDELNPTIEDILSMEDETACSYESGIEKEQNDFLPVLTPEREKELGRIIKEGGEGVKAARDELITANLRLVRYVANKYAGRGVDIDDLVSMGSFGLIRAVDKFDYTLGFRFSTYAIWWIKQAISRGIAEYGGIIRLPVKKANLRSEYTTVSFDAEVGEDGSTIKDFIADENAIDPCEYAEKVELKEKVAEVLGMLEPKEARVLTLRFGIGTDAPMSLDEVASLPEFGFSREYIRQIEMRALNRIRNNNRMCESLSGYVRDNRKEYRNDIQL